MLATASVPPSIFVSLISLPRPGSVIAGPYVQSYDQGPSLDLDHQVLAVVKDRARPQGTLRSPAAEGRRANRVDRGSGARRRAATSPQARTRIGLGRNGLETSAAKLRSRG